MNPSLLDTDIYSEVLKGFDPAVRANAMAYRRDRGVLTLSVVTMMEIIRGHERRQAPGRLQAFLAVITLEEVLPFDQGCARLAGKIGGELQRTGQLIGLADTMIAAIALVNKLELVTGNTAHFERVARLGYPLTLTNWRI